MKIMEFNDDGLKRILRLNFVTGLYDITIINEENGKILRFFTDLRERNIPKSATCLGRVSFINAMLEHSISGYYKKNKFSFPQRLEGQMLDNYISLVQDY